MSIVMIFVKKCFKVFDSVIKSISIFVVNNPSLVKIFNSIDINKSWVAWVFFSEIIFHYKPMFQNQALSGKNKGMIINWYHSIARGDYYRFSLFYWFIGWIKGAYSLFQKRYIKFLCSSPCAFACGRSCPQRHTGFSTKDFSLASPRISQKNFFAESTFKFHMISISNVLGKCNHWSCWPLVRDTQRE